MSTLARQVPMSTKLAQDRLGDFLVSEGLVSRDQLQSANAEASASNTRVGAALVKLGYVEEGTLVLALARQYRVQAVDLDRLEVEQKILRLVSPEVALKHLVLPLRRVGRRLTVAMVNPTDLSAIDDLKFASGYEIEPVLAGEVTLRRHLEKYYDAVDERMQEILSDILDEGDIELLEDDDEEVSVAALREQVDAAPVVRFINGLLTDAVMKGASDIHIEPFEKEIRVRYRIDGALQEIMKPPFKMKPALTSRIKILADMNIAERRVP
ncbi:MAG: type II secretion system protein GspE, partial [Gemmatimonadales bacterium]